MGHHISMCQVTIGWQRANTDKIIFKIFYLNIFSFPDGLTWCCSLVLFVQSYN